MSRSKVSRIATSNSIWHLESLVKAIIFSVRPCELSASTLSFTSLLFSQLSAFRLGNSPPSLFLSATCRAPLNVLFY